ncbi:unnamed protein product [Linum tenue]|uniref:Uncharacterized protein n=1 Tax=Linum tenue TaxID=586396 RepID=A0AAV0KHA8_9ROSI|nr:unnamed protein product [Linum tenue]
MLNSGEPELFADQEAARTSVEEELARDMVMMAQFEEQMRQWERERRERRLRDPQCFGPEAVDRTAAWLRAGLASAQGADDDWFRYSEQHCESCFVVNRVLLICMPSSSVLCIFVF